MKRLGVLGSMVWDRIHARDGHDVVIEEWGGLAYALAAAAAARPAGCDIVPIVKIGRDLEETAQRFFAGLPGLSVEAGVLSVAEPNNRVELRYVDRDRRCEQMSGGVPPWTWPELEPIVRGLDGLYINFLSGFEMNLDAAQALRKTFAGPIYTDLHSIFLGIDATGMRWPKPLESWREWLRCFDLVQVNEEELGLLSSAYGDPWRFAAEVVGDEPRALFVTLGSRGAAYIVSDAFGDGPLAWRRQRVIAPAIVKPGGAISRKFEPRAGALEGDPTGCGDVWGATCCCALYAGMTLDEAMQRALDAASINVLHRGATGLYERLTGRVAA
ncbi:MAG: carbohydrate kinase family protein [Longimicrobiales bacterium]